MVSPSTALYNSDHISHKQTVSDDTYNRLKNHTDWPLEAASFPDVQSVNEASLLGSEARDAVSRYYVLSPGTQP